MATLTQLTGTKSPQNCSPPARRSFTGYCYIAYGYYYAPTYCPPLDPTTFNPVFLPATLGSLTSLQTLCVPIC
jgi:hypothetical protein